MPLSSGNNNANLGLVEIETTEHGLAEIPLAGKYLDD